MPGLYFFAVSKKTRHEKLQSFRKTRLKKLMASYIIEKEDNSYAEKED